MTEAAWLACEDPRKMLVWVRAAATDRKLRLFACAFWRWRTQRRTRRTGETDPEMDRALDYAERWAESGEPPRGSGPRFGLRFRWHPLFARTAFDAADWTIRGSAIYGRDWIGPEEQEQQILLLREVFGNPFRPAARLGTRSQAVVGLAREAYEARAFELLPLLGDALEDAGCDDPELLAHCRGPGPHVLGCWVLDLVAGCLAERG